MTSARRHADKHLYCGGGGAGGGGPGGGGGGPEDLDGNQIRRSTQDSERSLKRHKDNEAKLLYQSSCRGFLICATS